MNSYNPDQLYLSDELKTDPPPINPYSTITIKIPTEYKDDLVKAIKLQNLSFKELITNLINGYLDNLKTLLKPKKRTGRGNVNTDEIERVKNYLRSIHPNTARKVDIAKAAGVDQARCLILLNLLSGVSDDKSTEFDSKDFLVYEDDDGKYLTYGIYKDTGG